MRELIQDAGYTATSQIDSKLSAIGAPTRPLWLWLGWVYTAFIVAFGWDVLKSAGLNRYVRVVGRAILACLILAATWPAAGHSQVSPQTARHTTVGLELDALPYATGGYYASAWFGDDRIRLRPVVAKTTLPSFIVQDGFQHADIEVYAFIADYFFRDGFRGFWIGAGAEYWRNSVEHTANGATATWDNTIATLGGGYVWKVASNFYVNPWGAGHLIVAGKTDLLVGGAVYSPKRFTPELSLKIGWHF